LYYLEPSDLLTNEKCAFHIGQIDRTHFFKPSPLLQCQGKDSAKAKTSTLAIRVAYNLSYLCFADELWAQISYGSANNEDDADRDVFIELP
jgi:hypothetical protein